MKRGERQRDWVRERERGRETGRQAKIWREAGETERGR